MEKLLEKLDSIQIRLYSGFVNPDKAFELICDEYARYFKIPADNICVQHDANIMLNSWLGYSHYPKQA